MISPIQVSKVTWLLWLPARGGYKKCPPPYKTKNLNSFKHRHVAYQNDRIEMLITNLKIVLKNIAPSSNKISLST